MKIKNEELKMKNYVLGSIKDYLKDLSAKIPAPGGGSVAALSASMAASLLAMSCRFTLGKEKYSKHEPEVKKILSQALFLEKRFAELVDEDVLAYSSGDIKKSIGVPFEVCLLSFDLMKLAHAAAQKCNHRLISDVALAAILAESSFTAGYLYVQVNVGGLNDKKKRYDGFNKRLKPLMKKIRIMRKKIEVDVGYSA